MHDEHIQHFDAMSSTFGYFLVHRAAREVMAVDSVDGQVESDLAIIKRLDLHRRIALETQAHAA
jgi:predicted rRNA methylase YqxC with S4 and FtsJ domains